jgi:hypothetical protein
LLPQLAQLSLVPSVVQTPLQHVWSALQMLPQTPPQRVLVSVQVPLQQV